MSTRFDPHENFKFRVMWDGRHIPGGKQGQCR
jgi:hypothetical protein